jgi:hypothetical protein
LIPSTAVIFWGLKTILVKLDRHLAKLPHYIRDGPRARYNPIVRTMHSPDMRLIRYNIPGSPFRDG